MRIRLTPRCPRSVANEPSDRGLELVEVKNERVRAALNRIDEMSDHELRELVRDEPAIVVDAAEGIIARRRSPDQS
jgi:hypothetical protein